MKHGYAREKMGGAVYSLATGTGNLKERLWYAYLSFSNLEEKDFPDELKIEWNFIHTTLINEPPSYNASGEVTNGRVQNTLELLDEDTCATIAKSIYELNAKLRRGD